MLTVKNHHVDKAPTFNREEYDYLSYFENEYREQWIFCVRGNEITLYGGDCGWEPLTVFQFGGDDLGSVVEKSVVEKIVIVNKKGEPMTLTTTERAWVLACIQAAFKLKRTP